jgi:two-component system, NtrC family, response regulator AtoC
MAGRGAVLLVGDAGYVGARLADALTRRGFDTTVVPGDPDATAALEQRRFDVALIDHHPPQLDGLALCARLTAAKAEMPVLLATHAGTLEGAVAAMRAGAYDFLFPPMRVDAMALALDRAVEHAALRREVRRLRQVVGHGHGPELLLGGSPAMRELHDLVLRAADSDASVLVTGETGTGKELVARALHRRSRRAAGPFVAVNCAAVPEALLESELFGHVKGAFTDARADRSGLFVQADGGTIFLDEIGDMPLGLQPKLLRALQDHAVRPVGSDRELPFDARVVAATNRDLGAAVEAAHFRRDLYFRLDVIQVDVPPLRSRGRDVLLLAQHFLEGAAGRAGKAVRTLSPDAAAALLAYPWPGNVRELENVVERAVALSRSPELTVLDLPERLRARAPESALPVLPAPDALPTLAEVEEQHLRRVLQSVQGNKARAARVLDIDRKRLYRKLERYGIGDGGD